MKNSKEEIILSHSRRNMNVLFEFFEDQSYLSTIAKKIDALDRGVVFILTGFYVNGHAETDGPIGAFFLAKALKTLRFSPIIVSDIYYDGFFDVVGGSKSMILPLDISIDDIKAILSEMNPVAMISIERCGRNSDGKFCNMRKRDISAFTAPLDLFFLEADCLKIGIGDGGNEIGMGNYYKEIRDNLPDIEPSIVKCDHLIIATTSNWGAYGLIAALSESNGTDLLPDFEEVRRYLNFLSGLGAVDGISGLNELKIDGFHIEMDGEILALLKRRMLFLDDFSITQDLVPV